MGAVRQIAEQGAQAGQEYQLLPADEAASLIPATRRILLRPQGLGHEPPAVRGPVPPGSGCRLALKGIQVALAKSALRRKISVVHAAQLPLHLPRLVESMPFPESQRCIYDANPLAEVLCQVRFPTILRIDSALPVEFQEALRCDFPLFKEVKRKSPIDGAPDEVKRIFGEALPNQPLRVGFEFSSADRKWSVSLTRDSLSLKTSDYARWEAFREKFQRLLDILVTQYRPAFFERIGLRYIDVIDRHRLKLGGKAWPEFLSSNILGELGAEGIGDRVVHLARESVIELGNGNGRVLLRHGLQGDRDNGNPVYIIDSDFYVEQRTNSEDAVDILNSFNRQSGNLFRWCITDALHRAMAPKQVD